MPTTSAQSDSSAFQAQLDLLNDAFDSERSNAHIDTATSSEMTLPIDRIYNAAETQFKSALDALDREHAAELAHALAENAAAEAALAEEQKKRLERLEQRQAETRKRLVEMHAAMVDYMHQLDQYRSRQLESVEHRLAEVKRKAATALKQEPI